MGLFIMTLRGGKEGILESGIFFGGGWALGSGEVRNGQTSSGV